MAIELKSIPTLKGEEAERFVKEADKAFQNRGKVDYTKHVREARSVLKKAKML